MSVYLKELVKIPLERQSHALHREGVLEQYSASGMVPLWDLSMLPTKTLCTHTYGHRLLNTPLTVSPVSHNEHQGWIWSSSIIFELRINISRMGGVLHVTMSDAVASLLHFERAIKKEKGVTTSVLLPSSTVGILLLWSWPSCRKYVIFHEYPWS